MSVFLFYFIRSRYGNLVFFLNFDLKLCFSDCADQSHCEVAHFCLMNCFLFVVFNVLGFSNISGFVILTHLHHAGLLDTHCCAQHLHAFHQHDAEY